MTGSVTGNTDYLVTNSPDSGSAKNIAAKRYGVQVISEKELVELLNK